MLLMLCAFSACAQAQSVPLTDYQPGQMIDAGFSQPVRFMAGCVLENEMDVNAPYWDEILAQGKRIRT